LIVDRLNAFSEDAPGHSVCGLVVTWQPDDAVIARLSLLLGQVDRLLIIDNGSTTPAAARIAEWATANGARYIRHDRNLGLSRPFNDGARLALEEGWAWLCIVDQDTTVSVAGSRSASRAGAHPKPSEVAVIGPTTTSQTDERRTGVLFGSPSSASLAEAIERLDSLALDAASIRDHALRFDRQVFFEAWRNLLTGHGVPEELYSPSVA
jgi:GT2 family glycosyltransferase